MFGYDHLAVIEPKLRGVLKYRERFGWPCEIIASMLIQPKTPEGEIRERVVGLLAMGIDAVRVKPTHFWVGNQMFLGIEAYRDIFGFVQTLAGPRVSISKLDRLLALDLPRDYPFCFWADFNPFVIGADGINSACCEQKYQQAFQRGDFIH
ncbi:hypothetical protein COT42_07380 [Candidatus Saganbacteria bacterium CG08_land_8_20_14_0_20_45_16]|uniref:Uncharacterized protein n=1 Tax=Candidatus Saganbacteria bacterium CG08_land_8_20_14_0_20_45_16 TaxID=2014293 RepID=A0A2H0XV65_UNCSA|nr:MAG: hypothetical protein COT42_07380 [Candidatus Saganbacteria bacterium CG08_land_8_20_14_0_20_45_16]